MKKFIFFSALFIILCAAAWGAAYDWTGDGDDDYWTTPENWSVGGVQQTTDFPGSAADDTATIGTGTAVTVNAAIANALTTLTMTGSSLTVNATDTLTTTTLNMSGGSITNNGTLTATNVTIDDAATLTGSITLASGGGSLSVTNDSPGTATITGTSGTIGALDVNSRNVSITTSGTANVTIGAITTTGTKNLTVGGTGTLNSGINTYDTVIIDASATLAAALATKDLTVNSTLDLNGQTLNLTDSLTIGTGGSLTLAANLSLTGTVTNNGTLTLGNRTLTASSITNGGTLSLDGSANQLLPAGTHTTIGGTVEFTGTDTTFAGLTNFNKLIVQGGTRTGVGTIIVSGDFELNGGSLNAISLAVTGTSKIGASITTTDNTQTYTGAVTLGATVNLTGSTVTFGNSITGNYDLTVTGNAVFNGGLTGIGALSVTGTSDFSTSVTAASVNLTGDSTINGNITTSGNQSYGGYGGEITLNANRTLESTAIGGIITTTGLVTAPNGITIKANGAVTVGIGGINNSSTTTGVIRLESTGDDIVINGDIYGRQLLMIAHVDKTITVGASTTIKTNSNSNGSFESASIYAVAQDFNTSNLTANSITPGVSGLFYLNVDTITPASLDQIVTEDRYYRHVSGNERVRILYSFTEDQNGDGKLDRIRVQANEGLNGVFANFSVSVEGYQLDTSKGTNGFQMVPSNNESFYIYLIQKTDFDGGSTPRWRVTNRGDLQSSMGSSYLEPASVGVYFTPTDTIPPRILYTLTLPGHPEVYVQLSEPVQNASFTINGTPTLINTAQIGDTAYLLTLSASYTLSTLNGLNFPGTGNGSFTVTNMVDKSTIAVVADPPPKYPDNWNYSSYSTSSSSLTPQNHLVAISSSGTISIATSVTRRVTDVLISRPPANVDVNDNYFVWPVWARSTKADGSITPSIILFDGSKSLEEGIINLQARKDASLSGTPRIYWRTNPRGGPLWQPFSAPYYFAQVPSPAPTQLFPTGSGPLYDYNFGTIANGNRIEFYFCTESTPDGKFIARLDGGVGGGWYNRVRPFCFSVQAARQRGGVIVLNNVINSNNREKAHIRYNLARAGRVTIQIYTLEGTLVKSLIRNEYRDAGDQLPETWDGSNNAGRAVARGMYFVRVVGPDIDEIRKIMVIK